MTPTARARLKKEIRQCQCDPNDGPAVSNGYNHAKADILAALQQGEKK